MLAFNKPALSLFAGIEKDADASSLLSLGGMPERWWEPGITGRRKMHVEIAPRIYQVTSSASPLPRGRGAPVCRDVPADGARRGGQSPDHRRDRSVPAVNEFNWIQHKAGGTTMKPLSALLCLSLSASGLASAGAFAAEIDARPPDRLTLSGSSSRLTETDDEGGGGSLNWLHYFTPNAIFGLGGEYQFVADSTLNLRFRSRFAWASAHPNRASTFSPK